MTGLSPRAYTVGSLESSSCKGLISQRAAALWGGGGCTGRKALVFWNFGRLRRLGRQELDPAACQTNSGPQERVTGMGHRGRVFVHWETDGTG